jgi:putative MATE family efflux protein
MSQLKGTYREIINIAFPLILGNLAWALIGITDQAFMGHYGKTEEAAVGPVAIFYSMLYLIGFAYCRGVQILIARSCGSGDKKEVGRLFDNTLLVMIISSIFFSVCVLLIKDFALHLLLVDENIIAACNDYLNYRIAGVPAGFVGSLFVAFYSGIGKTKLLSISVATMAIANIILNYGLVFGNFGLPEMGIGGSGLASAIAEWISILILVFGVIARKYHQKYHLIKSKVDLSKIVLMTKTATPLVLQTFISNAGWFVFFTFVEKLGANNLAISNILRQMLLWIGIPVWAIGSVTNTLVSNLFGQNKRDEIRYVFKKINVIAISITLSQLFLILAFYRQVLAMFSMDNSISETAFPAIIVLCIAMILMTFSSTYFNGLMSVCGTRYALYIEMLAMIIYISYVFFLFKLDSLSIEAAWTTEWIYWSVCLMASLYKLKKAKVI